VLSTGTKTEPDPSGKPDNVTVVTLLVTPEESETLALAQNQGTIQFVLRNGGDSVKPDTRAIDMAELTGIPKAPPVEPQPARAKRIVAAAKPAVAPAVRLSDLYVVETVANGKVTIAKFPVNPE
jgi:Flp pilus assembly protein CpaB